MRDCLGELLESTNESHAMSKKRPLDRAELMHVMMHVRLLSVVDSTLEV